MKISKLRKKQIALILTGLLAFIMLSFCASTSGDTAPQQPAFTAAPVQQRAISGTVASIDRFGNFNFSVNAAGFQAAGFRFGDLVRLEVEDFNGVVPVVANYSEVDHGEALVRLHRDANLVIIAVNMGNISELYSIEEGSFVRISLVETGGYLAELELRNLERSYVREDYSTDAVFANFREARLGSMGSGVLYRSTHPALDDNAADAAMASSSPYAARLGEAAGIVTVINLADRPDELPLRGANSSWYQGFINRGNIVALGMGIDYRAPAFAGQLKTGIEFMLQHDGPFLIHCNEGKDRAGVVVALFGALMGAPPLQIIDDYMWSYINFYNVVRRSEQYMLIASIMEGILTDFNGGVMPRAGETTAAAERYLSEVVGLTNAQIEALKVKLRG